VRTAATKEEVLGLMEPLIGEWFQSKFKGLTEPQAYAVPIIHARKNVLVSSPTGSGKTLTAFLSIINELYAKQLRGELEDRIYCLYVSPLKALANDINRNLEEPLHELTELAVKQGKPEPLIRVGVRSGDTSARAPETGPSPAAHFHHDAREHRDHPEHAEVPGTFRERRVGHPRRNPRSLLLEAGFSPVDLPGASP